MISIGATMSAAGFDALSHHWNVVEERAKEFGQQTDRSSWRLVGPMHIADTKDQAIKDVAYGIDAWFDYLQHTAAAPQLGVQGKTTKERIDFVIESGMGVIGTIDDAVEKIEALWKQSNGGFGCYLMFAHNWAPWSRPSTTTTCSPTTSSRISRARRGGSRRTRRGPAAYGTRWRRSSGTRSTPWTAKHEAERAAKSETAG